MQNHALFLPPRIKFLTFAILVLASSLAACSMAAEKFRLPMDQPITGFELTLHEPLTADQSIVVELLDPFSIDGSWSRFVPMTAVTDVEYAVDVEGLGDQTIWYRYVRQGQFRNLEEASGRFSSALRVAKPGEATKDYLWRWEGEQRKGDFGILSGVVTNAAGNPMEGVQVASGSDLVRTDFAGRFEITGMRPGTHWLRAFGPAGTSPFQQQALISAGQRTVANFSMPEGRMTSVSINVEINGMLENDPTPLLYLNDEFSGRGVIAYMPLGQVEWRGNSALFRFSVPTTMGSTLRYRYSLGAENVNVASHRGSTEKTFLVVVSQQDMVVEDKADSPFIDQIGYEIVVNVPPNTPTEDSVSVLIDEGVFGGPIQLKKSGDLQWRLRLAKPLPIKDRYKIEVCRNDVCSVGEGEGLSEVLTDILDLGTNPEIAREVVVNEWKNVGVEGALAMPEVYPYPKAEIFRFGYALKPARSSLAASNLMTLVNGQHPNLLVGTHTYELDVDSPTLLTYSSEERISTAESVLAAGVEYGWWRVSIRSPEGLDAPNFDELTEDELDMLFNQLAQSFSAEAQYAKRNNMEALVLDLDALRNIVPIAGSNSEKSDALLARWDTLVGDLRRNYGGKLIFAVTLGEDGLVGVPTFDAMIDGYWVDWRIDLPAEIAGQDSELISWAYSLIQNEIVPNIPAGKYIYIGMNTPATASSGYDDGVSAQTAMYATILAAVNDSDNIEGVISDGLDTSLALQDGSASVYGKPAQDLLWVWFTGWARK